MTVFFENECDRAYGFDPQKLAEEVIEAVLDYEGCPYEVEVNLLLTDNDGIQAVNKEMRDIDKVTDVLSFPALEYETPSDFDFLEEEDIYFHPESGELMFGDILLNTDRVFSQAEEYGHSVKREYAFLIAHSMLHLCGYDHMEEKEARVMEEKQEEILTKIGITRD